MVLTWRQTPRFCGLACRSLTLLIRASARRGFLISWLIVGIWVANLVWYNVKGGRIYGRDGEVASPARFLDQNRPERRSLSGKRDVGHDRLSDETFFVRWRAHARLPCVHNQTGVFAATGGARDRR